MRSPKGEPGVRTTVGPVYGLQIVDFDLEVGHTGRIGDGRQSRHRIWRAGRNDEYLDTESVAVIQRKP